MAAALAAGGLAKGATGMGLPLVALPALTAAFGLQHAISLLIIPVLLTNSLQAWQFRSTSRDESMGFLPVLLVGAVAGVAAGTWLLVSLPERQLMIGLGVMLFAYLALRLARPSFAVAASTGRRLALPVGIAGGILQGATGIASPVAVTFIHAMRLDRKAHLYAVSVLFLGFGILQLVALVLAGVMQPQWLLEGMLALVPILAAMPVGQWLAARLSAAAFDRMIMIFLAVLGAKLLLGL